MPGWRQPWDTWRVLMLGGSLVLLALAFSRVGDVDRLPDWFQLVGQLIGYALLGIGFFVAMRTRKQLRNERERKEKAVSPRDRG